MVHLPLPLFVSLVLSVMAAVLVWRHGLVRANVPFLLLIMLMAAHTFVVGLRWGYGIDALGVSIPLLGALVPALVYCGVITLVRRASVLRRRTAVHALGPLAILALMIALPELVDAGIIALFSGYAVAIMMLMRSGSDALAHESLETVGSAYRSIVFSALSLMLYALLDTIVYLELAADETSNAMWVISAGNLVLLAIMIVAAANVVGHGARPSREAPRSAAPDAASQAMAQTPPAEYDTAKLEAIVADVEHLLVTKKLYTDVGLSLDRLARRLGVPARLMSVAINRRRNCNVSQFVNQFRVAAACDLLRETEQTVTDVMFNTGFQTKSNFNREFRRLTGMTPMQWRAGKADAAPASRPAPELIGAEPARG